MWHVSADGDHGKTLLGTIDYTWLFAYAICMFFRLVFYVQLVNIGLCKEQWFDTLITNEQPSSTFWFF